MAGIPVIALSASLPDDVTSFNKRVVQTVTCHPTGGTLEEITESLVALKNRKECADLERERNALMERYKDNAEVVNALRLKFGFVGVEVDRPKNPK